MGEGAEGRPRELPHPLEVEVLEEAQQLVRRALDTHRGQRSVPTFRFAVRVRGRIGVGVESRKRVLRTARACQLSHCQQGRSARTIASPAHQTPTSPRPHLPPQPPAASRPLAAGRAADPRSRSRESWGENWGGRLGVAPQRGAAQGTAGRTRHRCECSKCFGRWWVGSKRCERWLGGCWRRW